MDKRFNIKNITDVILNKQNFTLVYITLLALRSVFLLQIYVDPACKVCLIWGIVIFLYDLITKKINALKPQSSWMPLILCGLFAICVLINYKFTLYGGIKNLLYCGVYFFVIFAVNTDVSKEEFYKYFKRNNNAFILVNFLITLASLATFLFSISFIYTVGKNQYKVGFWFNRLNGVSNGNTETIFALISIALSLINYYISDRKLGKIKYFYIINFVACFLYYSLSGSRAASVCYIVILAFVMVFIVYPKVRENSKFIKSVGSTALSFVLIITFAYVLRLGSQETMKRVLPHMPSIFISDSEISGDTDIEFSRTDVLKDGDITNRRKDMWKAALKIIKERPIFGVAYADSFDAQGNLRDDLKNIDFNEEEILALKAASFYFHNGYIQILLCGGILFTAAFLLFGTLQFYKYLKFAFLGNKNRTTYKIFIIIFSIIVALLLDNLVEVHMLFGGQDGITSELWYLLAMGIYFIKHSDHLNMSQTDKN